MREGQFAEKLAGAGAQPFPGTAEDFSTLIRRDTEKNGKLIRSLNIKPE